MRTATLAASLLCLCLLIAAGTASAISKGGDVQVLTSGGYVAGERDVANGFNVFRGIPFAEPPVGQLRWANPVPKKSWSPKVYPPSVHLAKISHPFRYGTRPISEMHALSWVISVGKSSP